MCPPLQQAIKKTKHIFSTFKLLCKLQNLQHFILLCCGRALCASHYLNRAAFMSRDTAFSREENKKKGQRHGTHRNRLNSLFTVQLPPCTSRYLRNVVSEKHLNTCIGKMSAVADRCASQEEE